jgi:hypothetical protein
MARQLIANDLIIFCHLRAKLRIVEVFIEAVRKDLESKELCENTKSAKAHQRKVVVYVVWVRARPPAKKSA